MGPNTQCAVCASRIECNLQVRLNLVCRAHACSRRSSPRDVIETRPRVSVFVTCWQRDACHLFWQADATGVPQAWNRTVLRRISRVHNHSLKAATAVPLFASASSRWACITCLAHARVFSRWPASAPSVARSKREYVHAEAAAPIGTLRNERPTSDPRLVHKTAGART